MLGGCPFELQRSFLGCEEPAEGFHPQQQHMGQKVGSKTGNWGLNMFKNDHVPHFNH